MINFARKYYQILTIIVLAAFIAACGSGDEHHLSSSDDPDVYYSHSVAFRNHTTFAWGANTYGQLGNGDNDSGNNKETPDQVVGVDEAGFLTGIDGVSAGGTHILAFKNTGEVYAWGNNGFGQLGNNDSDNPPSASPVNVVTVTNTLLSGVRAVSAGGSHSLALRSDGTVWAWGANNEGQLGVPVDDDEVSRNTADQISGLAAVDKIAAGGAHNLALINGQVSSWGSNTSGQLGHFPVPTSTSIITPGNVVMVNTTTPLTNVTDIATGGSHSLFVANGAVWACGNNIYGQIGDGTIVDKKQGVVPVNLTGVTGVPLQVAAGLDHSLVLMSDGTVWGWGLNNYGQLGSGAQMSDITPVTAPVPVRTDATNHPLLSGIVKIAVIGNHNLAVDNTGQLWVWGYNNYGQLGLEKDDTDDRNYATKVPFFSTNSGM